MNPLHHISCSSLSTLPSCCMPKHKVDSAPFVRPHPHRSINQSAPSSCHASSSMNAAREDHPPELDLYISEPRERCEDIVLGKGAPPEAPITCCMSGCPKCVWIQYGEDLVDYYSDGGKTAMKEIEKMDDPFLKAFVMAEVQTALDKQ